MPTGYKQHLQPARPSYNQLHSKLTRGYSNPPQTKIEYAEAQAGNIRHFISEWRAITQGQWVLEVVQEFQIPFSAKPPIGTCLPPFHLPLEQQSILTRKIEEMQKCGAIQEVVNPQAGFTSNVSNISCAPSPPTLQEITISEKRGIGPPPLIRVSNPVEPLEDLLWWCGHLKRWNGRPIHPATPRMIVETDASNTEWAAYYPALNQRTGRPWNQEELKLHINAKELLAAWIVLQTFANTLRGAHVHIKMDNTSPIAYINRMGGTHSRELC